MMRDVEETIGNMIDKTKFTFMKIPKMFYF